MIVTVTPNTAVDKTYVVEGFHPQAIHKPCVTLTTAGGKGVNVARVCAILGCEVIATGFVGGHTGDFIVGELQRAGVLPDFVRVAGETRTCVEIVDPEQGVHAKVNEPGPHITAAEAAHLERKVSGWLGRAQVVVLAGGGPPGTPTDLYARLIARVRAAGVRVILDASGELLRHGVAAGPFLVKPNREELAELMGTEVDSIDDAATGARALLQSGVATVVVSLGAEGAVLAHGTELLYAEPPPIELVSTVGSGDCLVSGLALGMVRGLPPEMLLRWGVAAGTANAAVLGPGLCTRAEIEALVAKVKVSSLR
ncbi:MAG: 1-phosphofructokinase [Armatimonadetes bacterium]|jgi:tagatose 6-phosphate kinase|nr:1-phosphofructokinase [Armatimonadota bacterium]